ncbi:MAG: KilA-N domain-containing protein [Candidatus Absconditabacteria bacterium]|nr:KilA-N domain-containing protein [Candidatus Absconditabacteria bacterium]MDD3262222.1 KilA-N domain-containing protein [Candidatus Absconditabacteria bacterium]
MKKTTAINVQGVAIGIVETNQESYISLTDMVKNFGDDAMIYSWMRNRSTLQFIGLWEQLHNPNFKGNEFETFKKEAGLNTFNLTPRKWIEATNAIGIISKAGRYGGGTYAHKDIAFEFASWLSPEFKLYLIKEFQRLKEQEVKALDRDVKRFLTKMNYRIHTDAIQDYLVPKELSKDEINHIYADEADVLNKSLFGQTAKQRKDKNLTKKGNMRDFATIEQLIILANLESINAEFIKMGINQSKRLQILNQTAISQMKSLIQNQNRIVGLENK